MTGLGYLSNDTSYTPASGINNSGQIVGRGTNANGDREAFLYENDSMHGLGFLSSLDQRSDATSINNLGNIVGSSHNSSGQREAFFYDYNTGLMQGIGGLDPFNVHSLALDVNDANYVVGVSRSVNSGSEAFVWDPVSGMQGLGFLNSSLSASVARAINETGQITGYSINSFGQGEAFIYDNGVMMGLGALPSGGETYANDINDAGYVVGYGYDFSAGSQNRAILYDGSEIIDLNTLLPTNSGWELFTAEGINNQNQIVGYGRYSGQGRAFLLTLDESEPTVATPEPASLAIWGLGLLGVGAIIARRRRRRLGPNIDKPVPSAK